MARGTIVVDVENCKGCELCIQACPLDSLGLSPRINTQGYHYSVLVKDNCNGCINCALVCPDAVITVYREKKKERTPVARISNVQQDITVTVNSNPN